MALLSRHLCCSLKNVSRFNFPKTFTSFYIRPLTGQSFDFQNVYSVDQTEKRTNLFVSPISIRSFHFSPIQNGDEGQGKKLEKDQQQTSSETAVKPTLFQRFKQMYKDYWYVLIPVHVVTSIGWFGSFYFAVKSGLDVVALLESMGVSEKIVNPLRGSSAGYIALAYAMYKVATPARYAVTLGGTTISINYLTRWGYIKPVPSADKLKLMYQDQKEKYKDKYISQREAFRKKLRQHKAKLRKNVPTGRRGAKKM